jgi:iron complex transport system permease protein
MELPGSLLIDADLYRYLHRIFRTDIFCKAVVKEIQSMPRIKDALFPLRKRSRYLLFCAVMLAVLFVLLILAAGLGSVSLPFETIRSIIVNTVMKKEVYPVTWEESAETILLGIRIPRILTAFIVGAGLTLCGILMQALTKNPLADPYVLGISHGASAGAVSVIMYGYLKFLGGYGTMVGAFCGAVISIALALKIAAIRNKVTATQLVLAGIAVSALFGAITNFMIYHTKTGSDKVKTATYWMMGSLSGASWEKLKYATIAFVICLILILFLSKGLDVLLLGDDVAVTVGVNTERLKMGIIILATLLTGVIVSISGTIGFVGLTIPHITRSIVGTKHKRLIPASVLVGGTFLVAADIISRVAVAPEELPIGVVSAFFGAPFFLYLIRKSHGTFGG